jgi:hypothetical protein
MDTEMSKAEPCAGSILVFLQKNDQRRSRRKITAPSNFPQSGGKNVYSSN